MKKIVTIIKATDKWSDEEIIESVANDLGFKGFGSGIGSIERKVKITITIEEPAQDAINLPNPPHPPPKRYIKHGY